MLNEYNDVLVVSDLMDILKIGRNSAYNLIASGKLRVIRIGRNIRIPKQSVIDFLEHQYYNKDDMICSMPGKKGA